LGLLAGAKLVNLEFMQIFSMTTAPTRNLIHFWKPEFLHSVKNAHGEAFIENYLPRGISLEQCIQENVLHAPFSVRDEASRYLGIGITKEIQAGRGSPAGGVYIDLRNCPSFIASRQYWFLRYRGIDAARIPLEVSMGFQCCNGGLVVDDDMATETAGLYAAGENAGGLHGADRLGGNMLSGCVISGKLAGQAAAAYSRKATMLSSIEEPKIVSLLGNQPHITPDQRGTYQQMIQEIREMAQDQLLLIKSREGLERTWQQLDDLTAKAAAVAGSPKQLPIELENMLLLSRALWLAASSRDESRGGFYREDFPGPNLTTKPKTHIVSLQQSGDIELAKVIADPEWDPDYQNKLTNERWG
jgi:succinate dehydrogenase/fumarate reductase flavoprotein subunit